MKTRTLAALVCASTAYTGAVADQPTTPAESDICSVRNNQVMGPNVNVSILPLLKGDPAHPKRACSVTWTALSPDNQPLPIVGCYRGQLLQVRNNVACGSDTGFLWVARVWVVTSADKTLASTRSATCQALDTTTTAATRDYHPECEPQRSTPEPKSKAPAPPPR